jgi:hypothetical protein
LFDWLKNKPRGPQLEIRDALFGDMPFAGWKRIVPGTTTSRAEASFREAKECINRSDSRSAIAILERILEMPELESRHYLQAHHFLRGLGVGPPPERAKEVLGAVVEVGLPNGFDLVAAYADHHARYYNYSGAAVVWERPTHALDAAIDEVLGFATVVAEAIGPWEGVRPPPPPHGQVRINVLAPSGLHFGQVHSRCSQKIALLDRCLIVPSA